MQIRTFRAKTVQEALMKVREALGPNASVLHSREVSSGLLGFSKQIEVTAGIDVAAASRFPQDEPINETPSAPTPSKTPKKTNEDSLRRNRPASKNSELAAESSDRIPTIPTRATPRVESRSDVNSQLQQLSQAVELLMKQNGNHTSAPRKLPGALFEVFTELLDAEIDPVVARQLVEMAEQICSQDQLADPLLIKARISQSIQQQLNVSGAIELSTDQPEIIALVGSTGVGKTTTLAKLAAGFYLHQKQSVGLITVDTFRMGAVEQLRGYAQIINLPMEVVERPEQMLPAIQRLRDCSVILLDTTGRGPRDQENLQYLSNLLSLARPTQVHLVVSATASVGNLRTTLSKFQVTNPTHLILTKLDEVSMLGGLLPILQNCPLPLSYITTGQNVPADIQEANRRRLSTMLLGQHAVA